MAVLVFWLAVPAALARHARDSFDPGALPLFHERSGEPAPEHVPLRMASDVPGSGRPVRPSAGFQSDPPELDFA